MASNARSTFVYKFCDATLGSPLRKKSNVKGCIVLLLTLLAPIAIQAMEVEKYDQMQIADQVEYLLALVNGTSDLLREAGRLEDAKKVIEIFSDQRALAFNTNLTSAEILNKQRPADHKLHVEHVFILTLKQNGITDLPQSIMSINKSFKPHHLQP